MPHARRARFVRFAACCLLGFVGVTSCHGDRALTPARSLGHPPSITLRKGLGVDASADVVLMIRTPSAPAGERGGTSVLLYAKIVNPAGHELERKQHTEWSSTNPAIATVDAEGLVTAQDVGSVDIIVDHKKAADTVRVVVVPVPVAAVTLAGPDSISVDDTVSFTATALDSVGEPLEGRLVEWSTSAPGIASVAMGEVIALAPGMTGITALVEGESATRTLRVWPQPVASVVITPAEFSLPQFRKIKLVATALDRRGKPLTGRPVVWSSSAPALLTIPPQGDTAVAKDVGQAEITATIEGKTGTAAATLTNPIEARALWVTRFEYTTASAVDFAKIATIFQKAASANFNIVYFQARTSGDALYYSDIEPCSPRMCGTLGGLRPAQDPLVVALTEAAKYGIQVHAWLNAYTGFISGSTTACNQFINSTPMNWLKANPSWSVSTKVFTTGVITRQVDNCGTTTEYMWVSPGVPQVRTQLARVAADIARRYGPQGLKGIHLDRIRFPSNQVSYDQWSQDAFKAEGPTGNFPTSNAQASWLDFRRGLVNKGVREVFDSITAVDPSIVLSAAVFPGYKPIAGWAAQWSYTDLFQDPQAWAQGGYLDVNVAMNYPATAASTSWTVKAYCSNTDWTCVLDDHRNRIEQQSGRHAYIGVGAIKGWNEINTQLGIAHERQVRGVSVYSYSLVDAIPNAWAQLKAGHFKNPATIPAMSWKPAMVAGAP